MAAANDKSRGTVAVTGANGFVGRAVTTALAREGWNVRALVRSVVAVPNAGQVRSVGNLMEADLERALEGCDAVVNCAARVHVTGRENPAIARSAYDRMNYRFAVELAEAARLAGASRYVQLSSVAAVTATTAPGEVCRDDTTPAPTTLYGQSKLAADLALRTLDGDEFSTVSLRPPAVYGPGVGAFFARLIKAARMGIPLPIGSIRNARSFIFSDNLADAVAAAVGTHETGSFIVTDSEPVSTAWLYRALLSLAGRPDRVWSWPAAPVRVLARTALQGRATSLLGNAAYDGSRFTAAFGWKPETGMADGLRATMERTAS